MSESTSVETQLAVINTKLDTLLIQRDDHETRLRELEKDRETPGERKERDDTIAALVRFKWLLVGAAAAAGGIAGRVAQAL